MYFHNCFIYYCKFIEIEIIIIIVITTSLYLLPSKLVAQSRTRHSDF